MGFLKYLFFHLYYFHESDWVDHLSVHMQTHLQIHPCAKNVFIEMYNKCCYSRDSFGGIFALKSLQNFVALSNK